MKLPLSQFNHQVYETGDYVYLLSHEDNPSRFWLSWPALIYHKQNEKLRIGYARYPQLYTKRIVQLNTYSSRWFPIINQQAARELVYALNYGHSDRGSCVGLYFLIRSHHKRPWMVNLYHAGSHWRKIRSVHRFHLPALARLVERLKPYLP